MVAWFFDGPAWRALLGFGLGIGAVVVIVVVGVRYGGHYIDSRSCAAFSQQTNRETKFVDYTWFNWDCLTPTAQGKWIPTDNLREFGEAP